MIDPTTEHLVSLAEAARHLPRRRRGKRPHLSCLYRWSKKGCRGVVLETIQVGGTRCTSREALARFFERLTQPQSQTATGVRTISQREKATAAAIAELEREGM